MRVNLEPVDVLLAVLVISLIVVISSRRQQDDDAVTTTTAVADHGALLAAAAQAKAVAGRSKDQKRAFDPLTPPVRRNPAGEFLTQPLAGVPTRGEYGPFHTMGYLSVNGSDDTSVLMGRKIHSNKYEYYTFNTGNKAVKLPIAETKELMSGDVISVDTLGDVTVSMYDVDAPKYNPYY